MEIVMIIIVSIIAVVLIVMGISAYLFKQTVQAYPSKITHPLDRKRITESMQSMLQFKTISYIDRSLQNQAAFDGFKAFLKTRYPHIIKHSEVLEMRNTLIVFKVKGESHDDPVVLMSHYDVVPENGAWDVPPFSGALKDGKIYGRGAIDTKSTLCAVVESVEYLLKDNHHFKQDIYLAFSGDEEIRGGSAEGLVDYLEARKLTPKFVLDEGGAIVEDIFPGVKQKAAVIGLGEKGFMSVNLTAKSHGGHASMPAHNTPLTKLSDTVALLNKKDPFKLRITPPIKAMFLTLAKHSTSLKMRFVFANLWLFAPIIKHLAYKNEGELMALLKTTQAFTMMQGSEAINVLPSTATTGVNYRLLQGETSDDVMIKINRLLPHKDIKVSLDYVTEATKISKMDTVFDDIKDSIQSTWDDTIVSPYLMMAATDSRYYHRISDHVYRFSPMKMTKDERKLIHGINEAIRVDSLIECTTFYVNLLQKL